MFMVHPKKPVGVYVTCPNPEESLETLTRRVLDYVAPMFFHDLDDESSSSPWDAKPLVSRTGDGDGKAIVNLFKRANQEIQVAVFQRVTTERKFLYGYFAMRHIPPKKVDPKFLDEQGRGSRALEGLLMAFPH